VAEGVRRRGALALRVLVSVALLGAVLLYADLGDVADAVRDGHWGWFVAAVGLMAVAVVLGALRWWVLLDSAKIEVTAWNAIKPFATSLVLNIILPTAVAGDAVRTWVVGKKSGRLLGVAAATVVDKVTALTCLVGLAWVAVAINSEAVPGSLIAAFAWLTLGLAAAFCVAALAAAGVRPVLHRVPERLALMIRESWAMLRVWAASAKLVVSLIGLGVAYQALAVLSLILVGKTLGVDLSFAVAAVSAAIVLVATLIPVSIGGLGIREGGFVLLLGQVGIDAAEATLVSLLSAGVVLVASAAVAGITAVYDSLNAGETKAPPVPRRRSA
jgi:glycosyltransferase 2 family protein